MNNEDRSNSDHSMTIPPEEMYAAIDYDANVTIIEHEGKTTTYLGAHFGNLLFMIEEFVRKVASSDLLAYKIEIGKNGVPVVKELAFAKYFSLFNAMLKEYSPNRNFSPFVNVFFDACRETSLWDAPLAKTPLSPAPEFGRKEGERFNDFVVLVRKLARSKEVRNQIYAREYNAKRNYQDGEEYIACLFRRHSRLNVLRLDFGYRKEHAEQVTLIEAQEHLKRFFNNVRANKLFDPLVGQIWKMEIGEEKGVHFHLILFFDGSKVKKDAYLAGRIGLYWNERITDGKGVFYNCNQSKNKYKRCGIGMINHDDDNKRQNLLLALQYLTKKDKYLRYKPSAKCRAFGKGNMPRPKTGRTGRRRRGEG